MRALEPPLTQSPQRRSNTNIINVSISFLLLDLSQAPQRRDASTVFELAFLITEQAHEECNKDYPCGFCLCARGDVLVRLVRARWHLTVGRECPGTGWSPVDSPERCGCCAAAISASCVWHRCGRGWRSRCRRNRYGCCCRSHRALLWRSGLLW